MKSVVLGLALGSFISLGSATASAAPPAVDYQKVANTVATKRATDAYRRGPERVATLPSRGKNVTETALANGSEKLTQKRGFFRNIATLTRQTTAKGADGTTTEIKTEAKTKVSFWGKAVKTSEVTSIKTNQHPDRMEERTHLTITGSKEGVSVKANSVVMKANGIPSSGYGWGHDRGSTATISTNSPTVKLKDIPLGPAPKKPRLLDLMDPDPPRYRSK